MKKKVTIPCGDRPTTWNPTWLCYLPSGHRGSHAYEKPREPKFHEEFRQKYPDEVSQESADIFNCPSCGPVPLQIGEWPFDCRGLGHKNPTYSSGDALIHPSERTVIYRHPSGDQKEYPDIRPGRADIPMNAKYSQRGYERTELDTHTKTKQFEKDSGVLIERRHYDKNSARAERDSNAE